MRGTSLSDGRVEVFEEFSVGIVGDRYVSSRGQAFRMSGTGLFAWTRTLVASPGSERAGCRSIRAIRASLEKLVAEKVSAGAPALLDDLSGAMHGADMLLIAVATPQGEDGAAILAERAALLGERAVAPETGQSKGAWRKPFLGRRVARTRSGRTIASLCRRRVLEALCSFTNLHENR